MEPVYVLRVRGTPEFEARHEILQPNGDADYFPVGLRRRIGLVSLGGDDDVDRDLRLTYGSALDRLLGDATLRARLGHQLADQEFEAELKPERRTDLEALEKAFEEKSLPSSLGLGLTGARRVSLNALVGLTASGFPAWRASQVSVAEALRRVV